jgi:heavy metal translocating P-type ATPase
VTELKPDRRTATAEARIAIASACGIGLHLVLRAGLPSGAVPWSVVTAPLWFVLAVGGVPLLKALVSSLVRGQFGADWLAGISVVTAVWLGEYLVGAIVILMFSGGTALELYATWRASDVLRALASRMPALAHRFELGNLRDIPSADIRVGDELQLLPHEVCPVDGEIVSGKTVMDESYLTGEPFQTEKRPGAAVLSGAVNGEYAAVIRATRLPQDSRYARIMQVMLEAEQRRPAMRRLADRLGAWYTPASVAVGLGAWAVSGDPQRFLAVMVIATPCPLLIAIPVAIVGGISVAARRGIIIRNPAAMEEVEQCRTLILDKTGTLTYGRPILTETLSAPDWSETALLRIAAGLERYSKHPLAQAVIRRAETVRISPAEVADVRERPGLGLEGHIDNRRVLITGRQSPVARASLAQLPPQAPGLEALIFVDDGYAGTFRFRDEPRQDSRPFVSHLGPRHAVTRIILLSGDRESEARYLADQVGITEVHAGATPEDKVRMVRTEAEACPTLFVGDGINDAPAMQAATVGVAFGRQNDITAEAADAVLLEPSLTKLDEFLHIARRLRRIALQSAIGGMAMSILGMTAAAFGVLPPLWGAIGQEAIDLLAVLNALRVAVPARLGADVPRLPSTT